MARLKRGRARLIFRDISNSLRVARLGAKGALVWTWLLAHCDDQGRIDGDASELRSQLVPHLSEIRVEDVEQALEAMQREQLIHRYEAEGRQLTQVTDWWRWQGRLTYKNPSVHPAPQSWLDTVTAKAPGGGYVTRLNPSTHVLCPNCGNADWPLTVEPGFRCGKCLAELLGTKSPRPKVPMKWGRRLQSGKDKVVRALARGTMTKAELAAATDLSVRTVDGIVARLLRRGLLSAEHGDRPQDPWHYRYGSPQAQGGETAEET